MTDGSILIFLFDKALIVALAGASAGKGNLRLRTPGEETLINKLAAIVRIQAEKREGDALTGTLKGLDDRVLAPEQEGLALNPAGRHIGHGQRTQKGTFNQAATMGDQIRLDKPWGLVIPVLKGEH